MPQTRQAANRRYYLRYRERITKYYRDQSRKRAEFVLSQKANKTCLRCGFDDPRALQFHHRDASQKDFNIGSGAGGRSKEKILVEIEKCDLICAKCHFIDDSTR